MNHVNEQSVLGLSKVPIELKLLLRISLNNSNTLSKINVIFFYNLYQKLNGLESLMNIFLHLQKMFVFGQGTLNSKTIV